MVGKYELIKKVDASAQDELNAYDEYRYMAIQLEQLGLTINAQTLRDIAADEMRHHELLRDIRYILGGGRAEIKYYWTAFHKGSGEIAENITPHKTIEKALRDAKHFVGSSWRFPGEVLIEVWDKPNKYSEKLSIQPLASEYLHIPDRYIIEREYEMRPEYSGVMVTVTDKGDSSWDIGNTIPSEQFDADNERLKALGKRPALGEYHY